MDETSSPSSPPPASYGANSDPTPYIAAAYGLGLALILGFATLILVERRYLRGLMVALKKSP